MKSWIRYKIVHCPLLWKSIGIKTSIFSGPYIPRWRWVSKLLEITK